MSATSTITSSGNSALQQSTSLLSFQQRGQKRFLHQQLSLSLSATEFASSQQQLFPQLCNSSIMNNNIRFNQKNSRGFSSQSQQQNSSSLPPQHQRYLYPRRNSRTHSKLEAVEVVLPNQQQQTPTSQPITIKN
ncbi:hypothetical protein NC652_002190 [Populus alba x Populus x berolinensis]|nr:hypothetical protein NC652_002190 [Populus alba x Populus x berolinensis]